MDLNQSSGTVSLWAMEARDHVTSIGHASSLPHLSTKDGRNGWWFDGAWLREKNPLLGPMCSSLHPVGPRLPKWRLPSERGGAWSSVLKKAKERLAWITMRSAPGRGGTVTSPCVCSLTPFWWSCEHRVRRRCPLIRKMREKNGGNPACHTPPLRP